MFLEKRNQVKLIKNRLFFNDKNDLIRIISIVKRENIINIFDYSKFDKDIIEYDTASYYLRPVFRIGEVARILDKKPDTIRKYEQTGVIPKATKVFLNEDSSSAIRIYTLKDIYDLLEIFSMRNKSGRPRNYSSVNQVEAMKKINARFQKIKNVGA
jgi:hypothetical protein